MKTLTYTHKKWVLAGCLLAALSTQSNWLSTSYAESADFASTSGEQIQTEVPTKEGMIKVFYIKSGDNEVMAVVPKTEGQATCNYCGTYSLPVSLKANQNNINELNVALLKAFGSDNDDAKETSAIKPIPKVRDKKEVAEDEETDDLNPLLIAIQKKCDRLKSNDSTLSCYSNEMAKLLKKKKAKVSQDELKSFFTENVAPLIRNELENSRQVVSSVVGNRQYSSREDYLWAMSSAQDEIAGIEERRQQVVDSLQTLIEATGKEHASFRRTLLDAESRILRESAQQIRVLRQAEKQNEKSNPALSVEYGQKANNQTSDLLRWSDLLNLSNNISLQNLRDAGSLNNGEISAYDNYIKKFSLALKQYLVADPYGTNSASLPGILQDQSGNSVQNNGTGNGKFQLPGVPGQEPNLMGSTSNGLQIQNNPYKASSQQIQIRNQIHKSHK